MGTRHAGTEIARRLRRALLAALVATAVVVPVAGAARPAVPAPEPVAFAASATPAERYAANRANIATAARMAEGHGDLRRAAELRAMGAADRRFLAFDGRGAGRTAEVFGDLAAARRVAVLVPGSDTSLDSYGRLLNGARALHDRLGARAAVVAWLGYETPRTVSATVASTARADSAADELQQFVRELPPGKDVALLCHSYGSVVCGRAAPRLASNVTDLVLFGSPGVAVDTAAELRTAARVWAGRGADDWIADVPHLRLGSVGFGADPVSAGFGARRFDAGPGGHSDYLAPGSVPLDAIARIVEDHHAAA
ncbi:alpha/beta hydrolase [Streptomyces sp. NPDC050504]|uniref:alpha/beta hydrolase n=1 Tax=Streptomyces sp. NPDC050504 TaxID=3365618 RepID=UPI0037A84E97